VGAVVGVHDQPAPDIHADVAGVGGGAAFAGDEQQVPGGELVEAGHGGAVVGLGGGGARDRHAAAAQAACISPEQSRSGPVAHTYGFPS